MIVISDSLFPMLTRLAPEVTRSSVAVKYSSDSTRLSDFTFTAAHISKPSVEPDGKDRDADSES
jgi:hypothetical protein